MVPFRDGTITIDGVDVNSVPLQGLRSRISVIPQDVKMFGGTIRQNLDLKNEYSDNEIWNSLKLAQMEDTVRFQLGGLGESRTRVIYKYDGISKIRYAGRKCSCVWNGVEKKALDFFALKFAFKTIRVRKFNNSDIFFKFRAKRSCVVYGLCTDACG